jgi:cytochrome c-type biogenesis protein CcmE
MSAPKIKLIAAGLIVIGAVSFLALAGSKSGGWVYFLEVDKYLADSQYHAQRVRLHGKVSTDDFRASPGTLTADFRLIGHEQSAAFLNVSYHGQVPDMFQPGRDVVVEGTRDSSSVFKADVLMTKCASKYEPNSPHARPEGGTKPGAVAGASAGAL